MHFILFNTVASLGREAQVVNGSAQDKGWANLKAANCKLNSIAFKLFLVSTSLGRGWWGAGGRGSATNKGWTQRYFHSAKEHACQEEDMCQPLSRTDSISAG